MLTIHEGKPGSGKSYCAVVEIISLLCRGCYVATNMPVFSDKIRQYLEDFYLLRYEGEFPLVVFDKGIDLIRYNYQQLPKGNRKAPNACIYDEAQIELNSRDWKKNHETLREYLDYLTHHRHYSHDLYFMTQDMTLIDSQIRKLVQYYVRYRDLKRWETPVLGPLYPFEHTMMIKIDYDGKTVMGRKIVPREARIFELYDSEVALQDEHYKGSMVLPKPVRVTGKKAIFKTIKKNICGF